MYWWVAGIAAALALFQLAALRFQRVHRQFEKAALAVQALATTAAIMFAGYWYFYERKSQPHANTRLDVVGVRVSRSYVALQTRFSVSNLGATLLRVDHIDVRLQAMNADSLPLDAIAGLPREEFPDSIEGANVYDRGKLMWPTVKWFRNADAYHIEPGETDLRIVDFIAPCRNTAMRVMFEMRRPGSAEVWADQAMFSLSGLCSKRIGSKEVLSERTST